MLQNNKQRFLSNEEKVRHFATIGGVSLENFPAEYDVKVYEGAEILLYHYDPCGKLYFNTVLMVTDIHLTNKGLRFNLVDKRTFKICGVGDIPTRLGKNQILSHVPYNCMIERTLKTTQRGGHMLAGVTAAIKMRSKSEPAEHVPHHVYAMSYSKATRVLGQRDFDLAIARLEARDD